MKRITVEIWVRRESDLGGDDYRLVTVEGVIEGEVVRVFMSDELLEPRELRRAAELLERQTQ